MFLNYRNYSETTLDGAINETQKTLKMFYSDSMPDCPFLVFLSTGLTLAELQTAERVLCYAKDGDTYSIVRDWDNMRPDTGLETTITGDEGDYLFPALFDMPVYFRIGDSAYLHRYADGEIEPPLNRNVAGETARQVGVPWEWSRAASWGNGALVLALLGDVHLEELQDANRPYELPLDLVANTLTLSSHLKVGPSAVAENGVVKYEDGDFLGYKDGAWVSLTAEGGEGSWTPPTGSVGGILIYSGEETLAFSDRILLGDRITIDGLSVGAEDIQIGDLTISEDTLTAEIYSLAVDALTFTGEDIIISGSASIDISAPTVSINDLLLSNILATFSVPVLVEELLTLGPVDEYPIADNGAIVFHSSHGHMVRSADAWHPIAVEDLVSPFPVPAEAYSTVSYDPSLGWYPTAELLLSPEGSTFAHSIIVGEKHPNAPLVAGMIEYVNNDIQGIIRNGESFVRVSLTNLLPSQRLPEIVTGCIPFGDDDIWDIDAAFTYANGLLRSDMIQLGSAGTLAGAMRYSEGTLQWHDGTGWHDFAGGSAAVAVPTGDGQMLVSDSGEWVVAAPLTFSNGTLSTDAVEIHNLDITNIDNNSVAGITSAGAITGTSLTIEGIQITALGITGVSNFQTADLIVTNTLRVHSLDLEEMPEAWSFLTLNLGEYSFAAEDDTLSVVRGLNQYMLFNTTGITISQPLTVPNLDVTGEVTFEHTITIGNEEVPGLQDVPGMIRYNGDFQGHLGGGRWVSFTLSLADGEPGLPDNPEAEFGTGLFWNGSQWFKSDFRIGYDGAILIGDTEETYPGILRWTGTHFQGCTDFGTWVNLSGSGSGDTLPSGTTEDATLRFNGLEWVENTQLRSDGITTVMPLLQIEPYENFYEIGAVNVQAEIGATTVAIKNFSTIPYGTIRFANHATLYTVHSATSESMLIGQVDHPDLGLTDGVGVDVEIYIQGVLPRPDAEGGQLRYNQNDFEGYVEGIGWVSFTGHLSVLPTRSGDPLLRTGHGLFFDGSIWRAYHDIYFRSDVVDLYKDFDIYGDLDVHGNGTFDSIRLSGPAYALPGTIRFNDNRYDGCLDDGSWTALSSPIREIDVFNGHTLVYRDGWWYNTDNLIVADEAITIKPLKVNFDAWLLESHLHIVGEDTQNVISLGIGEDRFLSLFGNDGPSLHIFVPTHMQASIIGRPDDYTTAYAFDLLGDGLVEGDFTINEDLLVLGTFGATDGNITGTLRIGENLYIDNGDLSLLNGMIEANNLRIENNGFFGGTVRVGHVYGPADIGAIRYSSAGNAVRGDWEGWDGEQWVSFTAGFHGQAIWGAPSAGDIVTFDGDHWVPSDAMSIEEGAVYLGRTFLPGSTGDSGEIRLNGAVVEVYVDSSWQPLNGGLVELPEGADNGQVLYWYNGAWLATDIVQLTPSRTLFNNVIQMAPYSEITPPPVAGGQLRYNQNDYEAYISNVGWVSLTGHVPFQRPSEHANQLLWSDGENWVANEDLIIGENLITFDRDFNVLGDISATGYIESAGRLISGAGVIIGTEVTPTDNTLYRDAQNRLNYNGQVINYGEANLDDSVPRGVMYYENRQYKNSAAVRMMTRN